MRRAKKFSQLPVVKKDFKNGAARIFFGPSYFDLALTLMNCLFFSPFLL